MLDVRWTLFDVHPKLVRPRANYHNFTQISDAKLAAFTYPTSTFKLKLEGHKTNLPNSDNDFGVWWKSCSRCTKKLLVNLLKDRKSKFCLNLDGIWNWRFRFEVLDLEAFHGEFHMLYRATSGPKQRMQSSGLYQSPTKTQLYINYITYIKLISSRIQVVYGKDKTPCSFWIVWLPMC